MKLTTRGEYGLRAIFDLALRQGEGPVSLRSIAERQDISDHYLEQLFSSLRKAGLVKSIRGAQGGYLLGKPAQEITVGDVIRVLDGPIAPVECVNEVEPEDCRRAKTCITREIWARVRDSITEVVDSITLEDMCNEAEKISSENNSYMYYI
ncbi:MAG TPA: Rrf2 family transcriptional regulator [Clostridia bacterium]|nr:Rrf2 family transcriptional regulator [Clostridia bacterium]